MENLNYPGNGDGKSTDQKINELRAFLNNLVDTLNYNFEQIESALNEIMEKDGEK